MTAHYPIGLSRVKRPKGFVAGTQQEQGTVGENHSRKRFQT